MQGEKTGQVDLFYYGSLDDLVPEDDFFRCLDQVLDLAWLRRETRALYSRTGRPSVDPVVFVKLLLIAYFQGITSERDLMRQVQVNLAYRRFLHYRLSEALPDHSSLTRSRQRLGDATIRKVFEHVLGLCVDAGLVNGDLATVDSTFVQANASLASLHPRLTAVEAQRFTAQLFRDETEARPPEAADEEEEGDDDPPPSSPPGKRARVNDAFVSKTDPDSGLYGRSGKGMKSRLGYLVHFAVDRGKQVITGVLSTGAQERDVNQIVPLVDQVMDQKIPLKAVAADRGYSAGAVYHELAERDVEAFIPPLDHSPSRQGRFGREHFTYDAEHDRYRCPGDAWLVRQKDSNGGRRYRARPEDCGGCPLRARCTDGKARSLKISPYEADLAAAHRRQHTAAARRAAIDRKVCSERTFAEAKEQHGLRRARNRGLQNMHIQALLTATVLNLKRYVQAQTRAFPAAAACRAPLSHFTSALDLYGRSLHAAGWSATC